MSVWRYTAVETGGARARRSGELAGESAAEVRALRRIGLQVIDLRPISGNVAAAAAVSAISVSAAPGSPGAGRAILDALRARATAHLSRRRRESRAELYDSLATMLSSGVPLLEAVETVIGSTRRGRRSAVRLMLVALRQGLRSGDSLAEAMRSHPAWFEPAEVAMVEAAQHSGALPEVLRSLSDRHERSGELGQRLMGALAYPAIVALVGLGVVVFLSTNTLPSLLGVLADSGIEPPALTVRVMSVGKLLAGWWHVLGLALLAGAVAAAGGSAAAARLGFTAPRWAKRLSPKVLRRIAVSRLSLHLSEMLRTGVPMVEALRVLAPTTGAATGGLRRELLRAADAVERGDELSAALSDEHFFDAEFRRLLDIGQASGELPTLLERIGQRYARQSTRLIDRFAALLEPCVILTLAALIGVVVMAAVLPLLRLQEMM